MTNQLQQAQKTIEEFDAAIDKAMKQHPDAHLFTNLRGAGSALAPRLLCAFGSQRDAGKMPQPGVVQWDRAGHFQER